MTESKALVDTSTFSPITASVGYRRTWISEWMRRLTSLSWLLCGTSAVIACQWLSQLELVAVGWHSKWPYPWDDCRYIDCALHYQRCFASSGIAGVAEGYLARPPYSLTLLLTSLPLLPVADRQIGVLHLQMAFYLILLDVAVFTLVRRLANSAYAGILALLVIHGYTTILFWQDALFRHAEMMRYQLNFPTCVLAVAGLAILVEGLYVKRIRLWSAGLAIVLSLALLLRPPAMPYFVVMLVLPAVALARYFWTTGARARAKAVAIAIAATFCLVTPHYAFIGGMAVEYAQQAQKDPRWQKDSWTYYIEHADMKSIFFAPALGFVVLGAIQGAVALQRLHRREGTKAQRTVKRIAMINALIIWVYGTSFILPTLSPAKNTHLGDAFLVFTLAFGTAQLVKILRRPVAHNRIGFQWWWPDVSQRALTSVALVATALVAAANARGVHHSIHTWDYFRAQRVIDRTMLQEMKRLANEWSARNAGRVATVACHDSKSPTLNKHNIAVWPDNAASRPQFTFSTIRHAAIAFVLHADASADPRLRRYATTKSQFDQAVTELEALGFDRADESLIAPGVSVSYFVRPYQQIDYEGYVPPGKFP